MDFETFTTTTGIDSFIPVLDRLVKAERPYRYAYMPPAQYDLVKDIRERNRIYWYEIVERAHCGAFAAVVRLERWLASMASSAQAENYLAFAAAFRGLLESSADCRFAFGDVPMQMAAAFPYAREAISGFADTMVLAPELEDTLIHFSHARRLAKGEAAPETHQAKTMKDYLIALQGAPTGPVFECYEELCNITHPAAHSILYLLEKSPDGPMRFSSRPDEAAILELCARGGTLVRMCVQESMTYPLIILHLINRLAVPGFQTPVADEISLDSVPLWNEVEARLRSTDQRRS